jgi:hypothetical protein
MKSKYGVDVDWVLQRDDVKDHHKIASCIAEEAEAEEEVVRTLGNLFTNRFWLCHSDA